jgi:hypothetical protein
MHREHLSRVIGHLKRALPKEQRLTVEEFNQLRQLSEAIIDYGRTIQTFHHCSVPEVIVEIPELAPFQRDAADRRAPAAKGHRSC